MVRWVQGLGSETKDRAFDGKRVSIESSNGFILSRCLHLVPGNQCLGTGAKWCSHLEYPIRNCIHSYSISQYHKDFQI